MAQRIRIFDYMKGIAIIAVLLGHYFPNTILSHFVYSFHIPLFFIVSGYFFYNDKTFLTHIIGDVKHLLLPILYTVTTIVCLKYILHVDLLEGGSCGALSIGPLWFVLALFWARLFIAAIFSVKILRSYLLPMILALSVALGFLVFQFHSSLNDFHLCIIKGMSVMQFVVMGMCIRQYTIPIWTRIAFILLWIIAILWGGMDISYFDYTCYPIDIIGGVGGTFAMYYICAGLEKLRLSINQSINIPNSVKHIYLGMLNVLEWCGQHSLLILCIHTIDMKVFKLGFKISNYIK